jgi:hypothetical protein
MFTNKIAINTKRIIKLYINKNFIFFLSSLIFFFTFLFKIINFKNNLKFY